MRRDALWTSRCLVCLCVAGAACGCGRSTTVTGKVTYKDRPVLYGSVIIQNADRTARSCAIQPDGSYTVEDLHPGEVKIAVLSRDPTKALSEVRRVLRAGGEFRFCEHVRAKNAVGALVQDVITPHWRLLAGGCHPNRDILGLIRGAGFAAVRFHHLEGPPIPVFFKGVAVT